MKNDRNVSFNNLRRTIDAIFHKHLDKLKFKIFISYFSYNKPNVSYLQNNENFVIINQNIQSFVYTH